MQKLTQAGFKPTAQSRSSAAVPAGKVIDTEPSQGVELQAGSPVTVFVSSGPAQMNVPEVTGQSEAEARASLRAAGLHAGAVTKQEAPGQAPGTVLSQSPSAGSPVRSGEAVSLVVAKAPQEVTVPRVVGKKQERAEGELIGAGFAAKSITRTVTDEAEAGIVLQQSPAARTQGQAGRHNHDHGGCARSADHAQHDHDDHARAEHHPDSAGRRARRSMTLTVALLAGGLSSEHEVSLASGRAVREGLERAGHRVSWVEIGRDGAWRCDGASG